VPRARGARQRAAGPEALLDSGVGSAGVDEGQACVNRFVVIAPCPRRHPQPGAVLLESHRGVVVKASLRLGPGSRLGLGGEEVHRTVDLIVVLAEGTNDRQWRRLRCCHLPLTGEAKKMRHLRRAGPCTAPSRSLLPGSCKGH
jgi:hypothetical protein